MEGGYELEHIYSHSLLARKNFYLLMQIAHLINQLVEKGNLLRDALEGKKISLRAITLDLVSEIKKLSVPWEEWRKAAGWNFQIRLDSS